MYDRILIPIDGSPRSSAVVPRAVALAAPHGTPVTLLRIVAREADRAAAAHEGEALAARFSARARCVVDGGDVAAAIISEVAQAPRTLIAMASRGHSGLMEAALGSVALRLVRARRGPILVYRIDSDGEQDSAQNRIGRVVLALDGSGASEAIAPEAAQLAAWLGARLVVVSVATPEATAAVGVPLGAATESSYVRTRALELSRTYGVEPGWEVLHGDPVDGIVAFAEEDPGTILAMSTHGRTALRSALLGSVTSACLRRTTIPIFMRAA